MFPCWVGLLSWAPKAQSGVEQWEKSSVGVFHFFERQYKGIFSGQMLGVQGQAELLIPTETHGSRTISFTFQEDVGLIEPLVGKSGE